MITRSPARRAALLALALVVAVPLSAQSLADRVSKIMARPEFTHAFFGIELYDLDSGKAVYRVNGDKFFTAASTTKLLTVGTALDLLGADYRFHTRVYRTGPIAADGTLEGDLVLVASGDPNLSGRIRPDGTLAFKNEDHAYGGEMVDGDPLLVIREIAAQVAGKGVKRIRGRVIVDASLFPTGDREGGSNVVISPIMVNDNVIDAIVTPGGAVGAPATVAVYPFTSYLRLTTNIPTVAANGKSDFNVTSDAADPDGGRRVTMTGTIALGHKPMLGPYDVPDPIRFAEVVLAEALNERGIVAAGRVVNDTANVKVLSASYLDANLVAEHVSPPFSQEAKITLKVSQNLHASMLPYLLSAVIAKGPAPQAGFDLEHAFLTKAKLDLGSASQGDGAGAVAHYTPDFMVTYLAFMAKHKSYQAFFDALPVLGKDGTVWNIQTASAAAGYVHGKTGTFGESDLLNQSEFVTAKGLAGYFTRPDGRHFAFAIYINKVDVKGDDAVTRIVGQAVGEIAAAGYLAP